MDEIVTAIEIDASAERLWQVLTDFPAYSQWNSVVQEIRGEAIPGTWLQVRVRLLAGMVMSFRSRVLRAEHRRELRWQGQFLRFWLFAGTHSFVIEPLGNGRARFVQRAVYTGLLVPVILLPIGASTRRVFETMNKALKARAEKPDSV